MTNLNAAYELIQSFTQNATGTRISQIEDLFEDKDKIATQSLLSTEKINIELLHAAITLKRAAAQIGEIVHALGILLVLPSILQEGEKIEQLSLAAGNTGKRFDVETNIRVAEFKFNRWRGGPEAIRQNQFFKDFYLLAEYETPKRKYLYTTGIEYPLKFLRGRRALASVMSRHVKLFDQFKAKYGDKFTRTNEYYEHKQAEVTIENIDTILPPYLEELITEGIE